MTEELTISILPKDIGKLSYPIDTVRSLQTFTAKLQFLTDLMFETITDVSKLPRSFLNIAKLYQKSIIDLHRMTEGAQMAKDFKAADVIQKMLSSYRDMPPALKKSMTDFLQAKLKKAREKKIIDADVQ